MLYSVRTKLAKIFLTCTSAIQGHIKGYGETAEPICKAEEDTLYEKVGSQVSTC